MPNIVPEHLKSTVALVERAFPEGVQDQDYFPLLSILSEHLCEENLSVLASNWRQVEGSLLNDVFIAKSSKFDVETVYQKLDRAGLSKWLSEEE